MGRQIQIKSGNKLYLTHVSKGNLERGMRRLNAPVEREVKFVSPGIFRNDNMIYFVGGGGISDELIGKTAFLTYVEAEAALDASGKEG